MARYLFFLSGKGGDQAVIDQLDLVSQHLFTQICLLGNLEGAPSANKMIDHLDKLRGLHLQTERWILSMWTSIVCIPRNGLRLARYLEEGHTLTIEELCD